MNEKERKLSMMRVFFPGASFLVLALSPSPALAQLSFLDKVFSKVTDIDAAYIAGTPIGRHGFLTDSSGGSIGKLQGIAIEVLFNLGAIKSDKNARGCDSVHYDSTLTIRIHRRTAGHDEVDSVYKMTKAQSPARCTTWGAELGFGYSQLRGFLGDTFGLQGSIEELPSVSAYMTFYPMEPVSFYWGVRTGLTQLKDFRASVSDSLVRATGSSFEYGVLAGIAAGKPNVWEVFVEVGVTWRTFSGVSWSGKGSIPSVLQRPLRPSTRTVSLGGQISIASALQGAS